MATLGWSAGLVVLLGGLAVLAAVVVGSAALPGSMWGAAIVGVTVVLAGAALAAVAGHRLGATIDGLVEQATRPDAGLARLQAPPPVPVRELDDLFTALAALQQRVRVSDDLADRHRRNSDAASAGMFELLSGLVAAEEGARGQLAAELHDTVAQSLGIARRMLAEIRADGGPVGSLKIAAEQVEEAEESLRATMARTRPPALRDGDLAEAVTLLRDDLEHRYGLVVDVSWPEAEYPIPLASAVAVYRFFQEALLNVVKHADVDVAEASLQVEAGFVLATVRDRGVGLAAMPAVTGRGGRHVGLGLLRERARLAGGRLDVVSEAGEGTTLTLRLPRPAMPDLPGAPPAAVPTPRRGVPDSSVSADVR
ncbi:MAG TPA: ATP-binding protein [Frankiaceae bacterium]|nr:ATP-binding protein [Frankiaceae bacterium]